MNFTCPACKAEKPRSEFYKSKSTKTGYQSWCKQCDLSRRKNTTLDFSVYSLSRKFLRPADYVILLLETNEIETRQSLWNYLHGRTADKLRWADDAEVLLPKMSKDAVITELNSLSKDGAPVSSSSASGRLINWTVYYFGSWLAAQRELFKEDAKKFWHLPQEELQQHLESFVSAHGRLPLRQEFDGVSYPYWESYTTRFGFSTWAEVLSTLLPDGEYLPTKHGTGNRFIYNNVLYLSTQELIIGQTLTKLRVSFTKEVPYSKSCKYLFDFYLVDYDVYVEYYGLATLEYLERVSEKRQLYGSRDVIEIFKKDDTREVLLSELKKRGIHCE